MRRIYKSFLAFALTFSTVFALSMPTEAATLRETKALKLSYNAIMDFAEEKGIALEMSFSDFVENYDGGNISNYESEYYKLLSAQGASVQSSSSSSGGNTYYYNTGTSCPSKASYGKYKLTSKLQKGDIIFESKGGFGITGHIAIVEGIFTSNGKTYVRVIEAISDGVCRGILDDTRVGDKGVTVYRVSGATTSQKNSAVNFCKSQLGKKYSLDFAKDTSSSEKDWYCSELVWAAYKNQGIDIEVAGNGEPGVTPRDLRNSSLTYTVSIN